MSHCVNLQKVVKSAVYDIDITESSSQPTPPTPHTQTFGRDMQQPKGILKNQGHPTSPPAPRIRWDEDNIMMTEAQKSATMKITEPKTPYIHYNHETDEILGNTGSIPPMELTSAIENASSALGRRSSSSSMSTSGSDSEGSKKDDWSESEEEKDLDPEERERRRKFKQMRSQHYNMKEALKKARQELAQEEEEDDDDDVPNGRSPYGKQAPIDSEEEVDEDEGEGEDDDEDRDADDDDGGEDTTSIGRNVSLGRNLRIDGGQETGVRGRERDRDGGERKVDSATMGATSPSSSSISFGEGDLSKRRGSSGAVSMDVSS
ncbi:hypothetical protein HK102_008806 [Quaeritorhiza haematococci]|nr:hypothetical protein HK102_008806 [Quaeritorhiza haematococci]